MSIAKLFVKVFEENIFDDFKRSGPEPHHVYARQQQQPDSQLDEKQYPLQQRDPLETEQMMMVKHWLQTKLDKIDFDVEELAFRQELDRKFSLRLGPDTTLFDMDLTATIRLSADRLSVRSQGSFNTVKANTCIFGGRWMYEVQLHSKGVMQIGWCSNKCLFNENSGVGDTKYSYGFDGSKQKMWHISTQDYGDKWQIGDIITMTIDVENQIIEYYRNGISMGVAFRKIEIDPGVTFFPAVSLGYNQALQANFGNFPFKHPVEGYEALQRKPVAKLEKADLLLKYVVNLSQCTARNNLASSSDKKNEKRFSTKKVVNIAFCCLLVEKLTPILLDTHVIEEQLLRYISTLCMTGKGSEANHQPGSPDTTLDAFISIFLNFFESDESRYIWKKLINALLIKYSTTHSNIDYSNQYNALFILNCLCNQSQMRKLLLEIKFFKKHCLSLFLYIRPPQFAYMKEMFSDDKVWTAGIGGSKNSYLDGIKKLTNATEDLVKLQKRFLINLLTNTDGNANTPSSRKIFLGKLRRYVMDTSMEQRPFYSFFLMQSSIQHPVESTVALAFICLLVQITSLLWDRELPNNQKEVTPKYFIDGTFDYQHFDRLGGVLSHLRKTYRSNIAGHLGTERAAELVDEVPLTGEPLDEHRWDAFSRTSTTTTAFTHYINPRILVTSFEATPGNLMSESSLFELLDLAVIYYYCVGHKYIGKIVSVRDEIAVLNQMITETKAYRAEYEKRLSPLVDPSVDGGETGAAIEKLKQREKAFMERSRALARKQSWFRAVALNQQKRNNLIWLLEKTLRTLHASSQTGVLFTFVPEVYVNILPNLLDAVIDFSHHEFMTQFDSTDTNCILNASAEFLSLHSADSRIILASCKDSMLQALGTLTCHKCGVEVLEGASKRSQNALVKSIMRPYENRAWGQSNWLLLRFWLGDGFAYRDSRQPSPWQGGKDVSSLGLCRSRAKAEAHTGLLHHIAPPYPSKYFQKLIGTKLTEDEPLATTFLNSVLSQLNWAFSEFILLLQEIQNAVNRQESTVFEPKQLKICSMCFELTVSLMRCLEMVITIAPDICLNSARPNSDLILTRICQLVSQVLSRVTVPPGCFQHVVDMCSADLNSVSHFAIITAALGILLALMRTELTTDIQPSKVTRISRALLTDPSFQLSNMEFALGIVRMPIWQPIDIPRGNFDPQARGHIDPLTNNVHVSTPSTSAKRIRSDPPVMKFSLTDFPSHVSPAEVEEVTRLIEMLRQKQTLLSDIILPSEDSLCPICCAKSISVSFTPCKHMSCSNCILQHLMNSKVCFYCKAAIKSIETVDGTVIYENADYISPVRVTN